jgi:hypothetical protein
LTLVVDTHVHVYPGHDLASALRAGLENLTCLARAAGAPDAALALCLTERHDCHVFEDLALGRSTHTGFELSCGPEPAAVRLTCTSGTLHVFAGSQIATRERLEVLTLGTRVAQTEGAPVCETIEAALDTGAVTVLPWSPGKWLGARGRLLRDLLALPSASRLGQLLLADSSLRGRGLRAPALFAVARLRGIAVAAGTDPLPLPGEERLIGTYASLSPVAFDGSQPVTALRAALAHADLRVVGRRRSLPDMLRALVRLRLRGPRPGALS